jgi:sulfoacetaldehyde dehydrogenase
MAHSVAFSFKHQNVTIVHQPQCLANSGAWTNGMPMSMTLGCGTWGGNSTSSNVTWEHLLNYT